MSKLARVGLVAGQECERQGVGLYELSLLIKAYSHAQSEADLSFAPTGQTLRDVHALICPGLFGRFRTTPVRFPDYSFAIARDNIPQAMSQWSKAIDAMWDLLRRNPELRSETYAVRGVDALVKSLLDIHPFTDGNGRLAWIVRTWLLDQWDHPENLPDYYGESKA